MNIKKQLISLARAEVSQNFKALIIFETELT